MDAYYMTFFINQKVWFSIFVNMTFSQPRPLGPIIFLLNEYPINWNPLLQIGLT